MPVAFVSYAREDMRFVKALIKALSDAGQDIAWDKEGRAIRPAAPFWPELEAAIRRSGKFIFIISPSSVASRMCRRELDFARSLNKQVIPVMRRDVPGLSIPKGLDSANWVHFENDTDFSTGLAELTDAITSDLDVAAEHARLLDREAGWRSSGRNRSQLLRGRDLKASERFLVNAPAEGSTSSTPGQREYVAASRRGRHVRRGIGAAVLAVVVGLGTFGLVQLNTAGQASGQATANRIANEADQVQATDPSLAAQLNVAANAANPTPASETRLLAASTEPLSSKLTGPAGRDDSMAYSPDGNVLAVGTSDGKVWLYSMTDPSHPVPLGSLVTGNDVDAMTFSPDGTILAASSGDAVWRWRFASPARPARPVFVAPLLTGPARPTGKVAFSRDGHTLIASDSSNQIWRWSIINPARPVRLGTPLSGSKAGFLSLAISPVADILATTDRDAVWLWSLADPSRPARIGKPLTGSAAAVDSLAFSRDGRYLAVGTDDHRVRRWNVANPAHPVRLGAPLTGPSGLVATVAFSPDGTRLAASSYGNQVWLWNLADPGNPVPFGSPLTGPETAIDSMAFSPDGRYMATGAAHGTIRLWNLPASVLTGPGGQINTVSFGPSGRTMAASDTKGTVWLWNLAAPRRPGQVLAVGTGSIDSALSPDGRTLAATASLGAAGTEVQLWDVADPARPIRLGPLRFPHATTAAVAFSPDGKTLAVGGAADQGRKLVGRVWLFNVSDPAHPVHVGPVLPGPVFAVVSVAFSRVGGLLAESGGDSTIWLWNVANPAHPVRYSPPLKASASSVVSVAFSPDSRLLAAASGIGVGLWNLADPRHPAAVGTLGGPTTEVTSVAFSHGGTILAAASQDGKAWLWSVAGPASPASLGQPLTGPAAAFGPLAFSPDGKMLAAGGTDGIVQLWTLDVDAAIARICVTTGNNLTAPLWNQDLPGLPYAPPCAHPGHYGVLAP
jgi:WD40 repeat protein